jgi:2-polyprenyl-3-methyl-5-hydroxy-6-metoxy-1,4-benzoquinol methylase
MTISLSDKSNSLIHYSMNNGRIAGWQIGKNYGMMDNRQKEMENMLRYLNKKLTITDLGCSDGSLLFMLYKNGIIEKAVGYDLWIEGIIWANEYKTKNNIPMNFVICDMEDVEKYNFDHTDVTILGEVLEHFADPVNLLSIASRISEYVLISIPINEPEKLKEGDIKEHIIEYDTKLLNDFLKLVNLKIVKSSIVVTGKWENYIVLARKGDYNEKGLQ